MRACLGVVVALALAACASPGAGGASQPSQPSQESGHPLGSSAPEPLTSVIAAVSDLVWKGSPPASELAASESGQRAIAALVKWDATHEAAAIPCGPDTTILAFVHRAIPFTEAVIASSTGPDDPKVTALLRFAQALRRERNEGTVMMTGISIPTALASYWRDRPLSAETFMQLGPTDRDVVSMGQSMLDCKITFVTERRSNFDTPAARDKVQEGRRRMGLSSEAGWFESELSMHDQFLAELRQHMTSVKTGAEMVAFVQERMRLGRQSPSSAMVRIAVYGLEGDAIQEAVQKAHTQVGEYARLVSRPQP
jgi:hypothetical protein